jgi:hypothetical protein
MFLEDCGSISSKLQIIYGKHTELCSLYSSPNNIMVIKSRMGWAEHVAYMEEMRNACKILVRKFEGKRPLGKPRHRCGNNIRMCLRNRVGRCGLDSPHSGCRPVERACEHGNEPWVA